MKILIYVIYTLYQYSIQCSSDDNTSRTHYVCAKSINRNSQSLTKTFYNVFVLLELLHKDTKTTIDKIDLFIWAGDGNSDNVKRLSKYPCTKNDEQGCLYDRLVDISKNNEDSKTYKVSNHYFFPNNEINQNTSSIPLIYQDNTSGSSTDKGGSYLHSSLLIDGGQENLILRLIFENNSKTIKSIKWDVQNQTTVLIHENNDNEYAECFKIDNNIEFNNYAHLFEALVEHNSVLLTKERTTEIESNPPKFILTNSETDLQKFINDKTDVEVLFFSGKTILEKDEFLLNGDGRKANGNLHKKRLRRNCKRDFIISGLVVGMLVVFSCIIASNLNLTNGGNTNAMGNVTKL